MANHPLVPFVGHQLFPCLQIAMEIAQVILDGIHAFRNPREVYLATRHHLQQMTTFGLAEFYPRLNSRDFEGPRIHRGHCRTNVRGGHAQLGELDRTASRILLSAQRAPLVKYSRVVYNPPETWEKADRRSMAEFCEREGTSLSAFHSRPECSSSDFQSVVLALDPAHLQPPSRNPAITAASMNPTINPTILNPSIKNAGFIFETVGERSVSHFMAP